MTKLTIPSFCFAKFLFFLSCLFLIHTFNLKAQNYIPYYQLIWQGIDLKYTGQYERADAIYDQALGLVMPRAHDILTSGILKVKLGDKEGAIQRFKQTASAGGFNPLELIARDFKDILYSFNPEEWQNLEAELTAIANNTIDILSLPHIVAYRETAQTFIERDQKYRSLYDGALEEDELHRLMYINDSIVQIDYMDFIKQRGFTQYVDERFISVLLHFTEENFLKYKPLIFEEVKKGNLDPFWFALMVDRLEGLLFGNWCYLKLYGSCDEMSSLNITERRINYGLHPHYKGPFRTYFRTIQCGSYQPHYH